MQIAELFSNEQRGQRLSARSFRFNGRPEGYSCENRTNEGVLYGHKVFFIFVVQRITMGEVRFLMCATGVKFLYMYEL